MPTRHKNRSKRSARAAAHVGKLSATAHSSLYDRSNGFLLGCFLALIRFRFVRPVFRFHRRRILEFLEEVDVHIALPASHRAFGKRADDLLQKVIRACHARSAELADFAMLGALSMIDATLRLSDEPLNEELREAALDILTRHKFDGKTIYDRFLGRVRYVADDAREEGRDGLMIDTLMTPAIEMLVSAIEPLENDAALCFVAMPFKQPYAGYYGQLYRPLAANLDCGAFRMWGGLSGEAYVDLMLAIMRRCKVIIADLSDVNPNVLYEFGVARGLEKRVVPLCRNGAATGLPANIKSDQLLQMYSPREKEWPEGTVLRCAAQVALIDLTIELTEKRVAGARWADGARLPKPLTDEELEATSTTPPADANTPPA